MRHGAARSVAVSLAVLLPGIGPGTSLAGTRLIPSDQIIVTWRRSLLVRGDCREALAEPLEPSGLRVKAEGPFAKRAKAAAKPIWESTPEQQDDPLVPQTGSRFELQGPFSK